MKWTSFGFLLVCALCGAILCVQFLVENCPFVFFIGMILLLSWGFGLIIKQVIELNRKLK